MTNLAQAASILGRRSAEVRIQKWGKQEFLRRMREWGKLGGKPPKRSADDVAKGTEKGRKQ